MARIGAPLICCRCCCALALLMAAAAACGQDSAAAQPSRDWSMAVQTIHPQPARHTAGLRARGDVVAWEVMPLAAEMGGQRVLQIHAEVGERVRAGQVLAVLDGDFVALEIERLQAQVEQAAIALRQAQDEAQRARRLQATGAMPQQQIAALLAAEQSAAQQVHMLGAQLRSQQLRLARSRIAAPDDGIILSKHIALGQVSSAGQVLFRLLRQGRLEWHARVGAADVRRIAPDMAVRLDVDGQHYRGSVRAVQPEMDSRTREAAVHVTLHAGVPDGLFPGMFATAEFLPAATAQGEAEAAPLWRVPHAAVVLRDGRAWLFQVGAHNGSNQVQAVPVTIVAQQPPAHILVAELVADRDGAAPITAQAHIVASGGEFLADGDSVRVQTGAP